METIKGRQIKSKISKVPKIIRKTTLFVRILATKFNLAMKQNDFFGQHLIWRWQKYPKFDVHLIWQWPF